MVGRGELTDAAWAVTRPLLLTRGRRGNPWADHRQFSTHDLDNIVNRIDTRPRRVLDWATSAELFWRRVRAQYVA